MVALDLRLAEIELSRLAEMVGERFGALANLLPAFLAPERNGSLSADLRAGRRPRRRSSWARSSRAPSGLMNAMWPSCWSVCIGHFGALIGRCVKFGPPKPLDLRVEIRKVSALQQRVVGEIDAGDDVLRAERDLLGFGEEVVDAAIEHEPADDANGDFFFRNELGRIQNVERELLGELFVEELQAEFPFRECSGLDRIATDRGGGNRDPRR